MPIQIFDKFTMDKSDLVRETVDGYVVATPRVARTGIQLYSGKEVGKPDMAVVRVYRPPEEVFNQDSMATFAYRPITDDHPSGPVTAENWRDLARGMSGGEVGRETVPEGEFIRVPMTMMDAGLIKKYKQDGKTELSVGYLTDLKWTPGTDPQSGQQYDAVQTAIRVNHIAVVDEARGGPLLRFGDKRGIGIDAMMFAAQAILAGNVNLDDELILSDEENNRLLGDAGDDWGNYGKHFLACDAAKSGKAKYQYPFAKDGTVYRRGLLAAKEQQKDNASFVEAVDCLLKLIDNHKETEMADPVKLTAIDFNGVKLEVPELAASVIQRDFKALGDQLTAAKTELTATIAKLDTANTAHAAKVTELTAAVSAKDAEIATLKKQIEDGKITPDKLDALVKDREAVILKGKAVLGDALVTKDKSIVDIQRQVVDKQMGDAAKGWNEEQVRVSFDTLTANIDLSKITAGANGVQRTAQAFQTPMQGDKAKAYTTYDKGLNARWQNGNQNAQQ